jgi:branched-chain amino acid transport system substrate-binding protein
MNVQHLLVILAIAFGSLLPTFAEAQTVKVGVVAVQSGPDKTLGDNVLNGIKLYQKIHGGNLPPGVKVELVVRDETSPPNPPKAREAAEDLIKKEKVNILTGVVYTPGAMAISGLTAENKVPFVIMNAGGSGITGRSPYIVRFSFTLWQSAFPLGQWAAKKYKTAYTVVSDFTPGHEAEMAFSKGFEVGGGKVIGRQRVNVAKPDFPASMKAAKDAKPEVVFSFVPGGPSATNIMKAYGALEMAKAGIKFLGTGDIVSDEELPNMGDIPVGSVTAHHYSTAADRPANKEFLAAWKKEYGEKSIPSFMAVAAWDGMDAIYKAVREQKGLVDPDKTMTILKNYKNANSPRGPISIDPETREIVQNEYIRETRKVDGVVKNVEIETIPNVKDPWKEHNK